MPLKRGTKKASALKQREGRKDGGFSGFVVLASWCWVNAIRCGKQSRESSKFVKTSMHTHTHMYTDTNTQNCTLQHCLPWLLSHTHNHIQFYWSSSPAASPLSSPHVEKPKIDMWTAHYKSTSLKLNCAKSIAVQIPRWLPLILIINLLSHSHKRAHISATTGLKLWESTARETIP